MISLYEDRFLIACRSSGVVFRRGRVGLGLTIRLCRDVINPFSFVFLILLIVKVDFGLTVPQLNSSTVKSIV